MKNSKSQTLLDTIIRLKFDFWAWISPFFHLKSKFLAFWHYYKVEIRFLSLDLNHFFIWNQNFWLSGTITRLKFDFWAWISPLFHLKSKFLAFWHYYKVEIRFLSLDLNHFFIWNQNFWLFDTITRLKFDFWAWISPIFHMKSKELGFLTLL